MMAKKVAVGLVGPGLVGGALLKQMESTQATLAANGMDVSVMAIASKKDGKEWMMCREKWITLQEAKDAKWDMGEAGDLKKMAEYLKSKAPNAVIIDTTSAEPVSEMYATWLKVSISQKTSA
jgi:aspartokinase/homoserine dehydrogenase 1